MINFSRLKFTGDNHQWAGACPPTVATGSGLVEITETKKPLVIVE